jgi:hypothetical protein
MIASLFGASTEAAGVPMLKESTKRLKSERVERALGLIAGSVQDTEHWRFFCRSWTNPGNPKFN